MKDVYTWSAIFAIVLASVVGDILLSRAMKDVGDIGELWKRSGLILVMKKTLRNLNFLLGFDGDGSGVLQHALCAFLGRSKPGRTRGRFLDLYWQRHRSKNLSA